MLDNLVCDVNFPISPHLSFLIFCFSLTFISPLVAYYVALHHFNVQEEGRRDDQQDEHIWESRLIAFGVMIGLWFVMFLPVVTWKYMVSLDFLYYSERTETNIGKGTCTNE
jgi:hypothetical protein